MSSLPGAAFRVLTLLAERVGPETMDRLWIFPGMRSVGSERGLVVASCYAGEGDERRVFTVSYAAEWTRKGLEVDADLVDEGRAPADRVERVIVGVVQRSGSDDLGDPADLTIAGDVERWEELLRETEMEQDVQ